MTPNPADPAAPEASTAAPGGPPPAWSRRLLRPLSIGLLVLPLAYLIAANLWLATGAHNLASRRPEKFQAEWSSAYSIWPGRVHFRQLELRGRNRKVLWSASLEQGSASLSWPELFARQVRIEDLRGSGFSFRMRPRQDLPPGAPEEPAEEDEVEPGDSAGKQSSAEPPIPGGAPQLPPIPGFDGLAEPPRSTKPPWTIELEDFALEEIREIWLERYRYEPQPGTRGGRFAGTLHLRLRRSVELPEFALELAPGRLERDGQAVANLEKCRLAGALTPFLTRRYQLLEFTKFLKADLELAATDSDLGALEYYLRGSPVQLVARGRLDAHLLLAAGVVGKGSRLEVKNAALELAYLTYWGRGQGSVEVRVDQEGGRDVGHLAARLDAFELGVEGATAAHLRGRGLEISAQTANLDLTDPRPRLAGEINMPATEVPDFRVYNNLWPKSFPLELESGKARLTSHLRFETTATGHRADGELELSGQGIRALLLDNRMVGDFRLATRLRSENLESRNFDLRGTRLDITNLDGQWSPETRGWYANIQIPRGTLTLTRERSFELELEASLADTSPLVAALLAKKPAFNWLSQLLTIRDLHLKTRVDLRGASLRLHRLHLEAGSRLEIDGELRLDKKKANGAFHLDYGPLSAAVRLRPGGDRDWKLLRSQEAYDRWLEELQ